MKGQHIMRLAVASSKKLTGSQPARAANPRTRPFDVSRVLSATWDKLVPFVPHPGLFPVVISLKPVLAVE